MCPPRGSSSSEAPAATSYPTETVLPSPARIIYLPDIEATQLPDHRERTLVLFALRRLKDVNIHSTGKRLTRAAAYIPVELRNSIRNSNRLYEISDLVKYPDAGTRDSFPGEGQVTMASRGDKGTRSHYDRPQGLDPGGSVVLAGGRSGLPVPNLIDRNAVDAIGMSTLRFKRKTRSRRGSRQDGRPIVVRCV